jgi:hypothetical protein
VLSQDSETPIAYERPSHADPLASGAVLQDLVCAALAGTHEVEASSSSSPACPHAWDSGYQLISTVQPFHRHTVLPSHRLTVIPFHRHTVLPSNPASVRFPPCHMCISGVVFCFRPKGGSPADAGGQVVGNEKRITNNRVLVADC